MSDVFGDESEEVVEDSVFGNSVDDGFEFDAAIANVPDGAKLVQLQGVYWSEEYKPEKGVTTYGVMVNSKIIDDGEDGTYNGMFLNKFIWLGNDRPDPRGVRNWVQFAEAALHEKQEGVIKKSKYNPVTRTVRDKQRIALTVFDDAYVVAVLSTRQKDGQDNQEIVAWRSDENWEWSEGAADKDDAPF